MSPNQSSSSASRRPSWRNKGTRMSDQRSSRRSFLLSSAASAALAAGAQFVFAADAPSTNAAQTQPTTRRRREPKPLSSTTKTKYSAVNVACIGIGGRGRSDLEEVIKCGANVIAICDIDLDRLGKCAAKLPNARTYFD